MVAGATLPLVLLSCCAVAAILLTASAAMRERISEESGSWLARWAAREGMLMVGEPGTVGPGRMECKCVCHTQN